MLWGGQRLFSVIGILIFQTGLANTSFAGCGIMLTPERRKSRNKKQTPALEVVRWPGLEKEAAGDNRQTAMVKTAGKMFAGRVPKSIWAEFRVKIRETPILWSFWRLLVAFIILHA